MKTYSSRKLLSGLLLLVVGVVITLIKGDIPPNLEGLLQSLYYAFVLGNSAEHFTNMRMSNKESK